jgi:Xaa-Pro aminopeptidase
MEGVYSRLGNAGKRIERENLKLSRLQKLRAELDNHKLEALLVSSPENRRYLSGFTGSSGYLIISNKKAILATDSRYTGQANKEAPGFEILQVWETPFRWLPDLAVELDIHTLGFEANDISYATHQQIIAAIKEKQLKIKPVPLDNLVKRIRAIKEPLEIANMVEAASLTDAAFNHVLEILHPGITEKELAWELEKFFRQNGSDELSFTIIVASGPNSALPHAIPTSRQIQASEPIIIDMGCKINGYCSDFTRTICLGPADSKMREVYNIVLNAQSAAISGIKTGISGAQSDKLARTVIEQAGYGNNFIHSLGHGIGLAIHELPIISSTSTDMLSNGMVFTIEPGIYLPGWGGMRIEDMITLTGNRPRVLTRSEKRLEI